MLNHALNVVNVPLDLQHGSKKPRRVKVFDYTVEATKNLGQVLNRHCFNEEHTAVETTLWNDLGKILSLCDGNFHSNKPTGSKLYTESNRLLDTTI